MSKYYYLLSSLPYLVYGQKPPLEKDEFLRLCKEQCTENDYAIVESIQTGYTEALPPIHDLKRYAGWNNALLRELSFLRAKKRSFDIPIERVDDFAASAAATEALSIEDPYKRELHIDKTRWELSEECERNHFFDIVNLAGYLIRLSILVRHQLFTREKGESGYADAYNEIVSRINSNVNGVE